MLKLIESSQSSAQPPLESLKSYISVSESHVPTISMSSLDFELTRSLRDTTPPVERQNKKKPKLERNSSNMSNISQYEEVFPQRRMTSPSKIPECHSLDFRRK